MDFIINVDHNLFTLLNGLNHPVLDTFMWYISGKYTWIPLYIFMLWLFMRKYKSQAWKLLLLAILVIILCDQISVHLFKEVFMRLRPCHNTNLKDIVHQVNNKCGGQYGFVSSHATNSFGLAIFSLLTINRKWFSWLIIFWAVIVSYSRVYLGVHFPLDIICGGLLGSIIGWLIYSRFLTWVKV